MTTNQRFPDAPVAAVGTIRSYTPSGGWQIASVAIDNPSGMWLELRPSYTLIPPNTLGRIISLDPKSQTIALHYVNAPVGGVASAVTGGPISVQAFDEILSDDVGTDYTLIPTMQNLITAINALQTSIEGLVMGWGSANVPLILTTAVSNDDGEIVILTAPVDKELVLVQVNCSWTNYPMRGCIEASIIVPGPIRVTTVLSGERMSNSIPFPPGSLVVPAGQDLKAEALAQNDPNLIGTNYEIWYFER